MHEGNTNLMNLTKQMDSKTTSLTLNVRLLTMQYIYVFIKY